MDFIEVVDGYAEFTSHESSFIPGERFTNDSPSYSLTFWLRLNRFPKNKTEYTIFHKAAVAGDWQPQLSLRRNRLVASFKTNQGTHQLISEKKFVAQEWCHVGLVTTSDTINESTLYINGGIDTQVCYGGTLSQNNGNLYIGKNPFFSGFTGDLSDALFFFYACTEDEVQTLYQEDKANYTAKGAFISANHRKSLSQIKGKSTSSITLSLIKDQQSLPSNAPEPIQPELTMAEETGETFRKSRLERLLEKHERLATASGMMCQYFDWLVPLFISLRNSWPIFRDGAYQENKLEVDRMLLALRQVRVNLSPNDLIAMAKAAKAHEVVSHDKSCPSYCGKDEDDIIHYFVLLRACKLLFTEDFDLNEQIGQDDDELEEHVRYESLFEVAQEFTNNRGAEFELCLEFCQGCKWHQTTFWCCEKDYADLFNATMKEVTESFPNAEVVGNKCGPPTPATFAAYIEGVGPSRKRDAGGRFYVFKKAAADPMPFPRQVVDNLFVLVYSYGDAQELAKYQDSHRETIGLTPRIEGSVTQAVTVEEEIVKKIDKQTGEQVYELDQQMYCTNWACTNQQYVFGRNTKTSCQYHPGRWEFGSIHGLWPEGWTCCRRKWDEEGCTSGSHKGVPFEFVSKKCVNRGDVNPSTGAPDSYCGNCFPDPASCGKKYIPDSTVCNYHSGYKKFISNKTYTWTCCGETMDIDDIDQSSWEQSAHRFVEWPDEESKIYFVTRQVNKSPDFKQSMHTSRFFNKKIQPYWNEDEQERIKAREKLNAEPRYCLNWGCESVYIENDNGNKMCRSHSGKWDFGHSGIQKTTNKETTREILWQPHWRCCGGAWDDPGCMLQRHKGPLLDGMKERKWKWPEEGAKRYFVKKTSRLWQEKLENERLEPGQIRRKYREFCENIGTDKIPVSQIYSFCMQLRLHVLSIGEDLSFMYKYQDVVNESAMDVLNNGSGEVEWVAFIDWWLAPLEVIRPEMKDPNERQEVEVS